MNAQLLHEALNELSEDLIQAVEEKRERKNTPIPWKRYGAMAACFVLVLCAGLFCRNLMASKGAGEAMAQAAPESPMMGEPEAAPAATIAPAGEKTAGSGAAKTESAQEECASDEAPAMNAEAGAVGTEVVRMADGEAVVLSKEEEAALLDVLEGLAFDPQRVCNCLAQFRVTLGEDASWEVNLEEGFVRTIQGQAILTEEQNAMLAGILERAGLLP